LLHAVAEATHQLISNKNLEEAIGESIFLLGIKMQIDTVRVYKCHSGANTINAIRIVHWDTRSNEIQYDHEAIDPAFFDSAKDITEFLLNNEIYAALVKDIREDAVRAWYGERQVKSVVLIPCLPTSVYGASYRLTKRKQSAGGRPPSSPSCNRLPQRCRPPSSRRKWSRR